MMNNGFKSICKYILGSALVLGCTLNQSFASYKSLYFDAGLDVMNYSFYVNIKEEDGDTEIRGEDEYVYDATKKRTDASGNAKKWKNALDPSKNSTYYEADNLEVFESWTKGGLRQGPDPVAKLVSVPAMKLVVSDKKNEGKVYGLTKDSNKGRALIDIVTGVDRGTDDNGNRKYSMVEGLNRILSTIEHLKGEYEDEDDFKNVLMGLAYLMENEKNASIVFKGSGVAASDENSSKDEEVSPDEIESDGGDIEVIMEHKGEVNRDFTINQKSSGFQYKIRIPIKAYTGYEMNSQDKGKAGVGNTRMKFKDSEDTDGKVVNLKNASYLNTNRVTPDDVKFLKLSDLIRHALIKVEAGVASQGSMNIVERGLYKIFDAVLGVFESGLGLFSLEELIYNSADINGQKTARSDYYFGMYPETWKDLIKVVYTFVGVISVSVLVFGVLRVFAKLTFDSMNIGKRYSIKEDVSLILKSIVIMLLFQLVIEALAFINFTFVKTVYNSLGNSRISFLDIKNLGGSGLANIVFRFIMMFVTGYMNIVYITRAITLALLTALAPAFIVSLSFGKEKIFATYVGEIISNIFMQSFHSIVFLFIIQAQNLIVIQSNSSTFTVVVIALSLIPLTKVFKDMVMPSSLAEVGQNLGQRYGRMPQQIATKAASMAGTTATVAVGTAIGNKISKGDQVRETISSIGKKYNTDMSKAFGAVEKAGGFVNYMREQGLDVNEDGSLGAKFDESMLKANLPDEEKNQIQALAAFSEQISDKDMKTLGQAQKLEKMMDMKTLGSSKNLAKAVQNSKKMGDKKYGSYNGENDMAKMMDNLVNSMGVSNLGEVAGALSKVSNGNNLYQDGENYLASKELFESCGMKDFEVTYGDHEGRNLTTMSFVVDENTKIPPHEIVKKMPKEVQGVFESGRGVSGSDYNRLSQYKSEFNRLQSIQNVDKKSLETAKSKYDHCRSQIVNKIDKTGSELGMNKVSLSGGAFDLDKNESLRVTCVTEQPCHILSSSGSGGIRYTP